MPISDLPTPPSTDDPANFDARADAFLGALPDFVDEANAYGAELAAAATPGGISIPLLFRSATADADPDAGNLRLSSATQNASTVIRVDPIDAMATDQTAVLNQLAASTNAVKGQARITKIGDGSKWLVFDLTAVATPTGYFNLTVTPVASSAPSPFTDGDAILFSFTRAGDIGATGPTSAWTQIATSGTITGSPATVTFSSIATTYSDLMFLFDNVALSTSAKLTMKLSGDNLASEVFINTIDMTAVSAINGSILGFAYRQSVSTWQYALATSGAANNTFGYSFANGGVAQQASNAARITAGVNAVRFQPDSGTFSTSGAIRLLAR